MIQRKVENDGVTDFPAVTFCNPQPFSPDAENYWKDGTIISPTEFNRKLRLYLERNFLRGPRKKSYQHDERRMHPIYKILSRDSSYYYTYIGNDNATKISLRKKDLFVLCESFLINYDERKQLKQEGTTPDTCHFEIKLVNSPEYFNCFTIQPEQRFSTKMQKVSLVIDIGPLPDKQYTQIMSEEWSDNRLMFMVHARDTYPFDTIASVDKERFYVTAGISIEVLYVPILRKKISIPFGKKCAGDEMVADRTLNLSNIQYNYTQSACQLHVICNQYVKYCNCTCSRRHESDAFPYCRRFNFSNNNPASVQCRANLTAMKQQCPERCNNWEYRKTIHRREWEPDRLKLRYLKAQNAVHQTNHEEYDSHLYDELKAMMKTPNLSTVLRLPDSLENRKKRFLHFTLKRQHDNLAYIEEEKLLMTLTNLFSEVGGLCSLFLGLSLTFVFELFELCGLFLVKRTTVIQSLSRRRSYNSRALQLNHSTNFYCASDLAAQDDLLRRANGNNSLGWLSE